MKWGRGERERENEAQETKRQRDRETETGGQRGKAERWTDDRDRGRPGPHGLLELEGTLVNFTDKETEAKKVICRSHEGI